MARQTLFKLALLGLLGLSLLFASTGLHELWALGFPIWPRRWCTLAACAILGLGSLGALGNKTWGLLLVTLCATTFTGVWTAGVAPDGFLAVSLLGAVALVCGAIPLGRRDRTALALAIGSVVTAGVIATLVAGPGVRVLFG